MPMPNAEPVNNNPLARAFGPRKRGNGGGKADIVSVGRKSLESLMSRLERLEKRIPSTPPTGAGAGAGAAAGNGMHTQTN